MNGKLFIESCSPECESHVRAAFVPLGAIAAAVPGIIDWLAIKNREVHNIANWHARLNIIALIVFAISLYLRMHAGAHWVGSG